MSYVLNQIDIIDNTNGYLVQAVFNGSTTKVIHSLNATNGEGGLLFVQCIAVDLLGNKMSGIKIAGFRRDTSGVLTLDTITTALPVTATPSSGGINGATFNIVKNVTTNDIEIQVTGVAAKDIKWQIQIDRNSIVLN